VVGVRLVGKEEGGEKRETVPEREGILRAFSRYGRIVFGGVECWSSREEGGGFE